MKLILFSLIMLVISSCGDSSIDDVDTSIPTPTIDEDLTIIGYVESITCSNNVFVSNDYSYEFTYSSNKSIDKVIFREKDPSIIDPDYVAYQFKYNEDKIISLSIEEVGAYKGDDCYYIELNYDVDDCFINSFDYTNFNDFGIGSSYVGMKHITYEQDNNGTLSNLYIKNEGVEESEEEEFQIDATYNLSWSNNNNLESIFETGDRGRSDGIETYSFNENENNANIDINFFLHMDPYNYVFDDDIWWLIRYRLIKLNSYNLISRVQPKHSAVSYYYFEYEFNEIGLPVTISKYEYYTMSGVPYNDLVATFTVKYIEN